MNIGIVGIGIVGEAVSFGLSSIGHNVIEHDIRFNTKLEDISGCDIVYLCVPTPSREDGSCDTSIVEEVVGRLHEMEYPGIIAIKSTVIVGTTERLIKQYDNNRICFVPEFLRERCAITDFTDNQDLLLIGTEENDVFEVIVQSHGDLPKHARRLAPSEAEICKYFSNIYNAHLIVLANTMYEICEKLNLNYTKVKGALSKRAHIDGQYLDCNKNLRGFSGVCLPKDLQALNHFQQNELDLPQKLFRCLMEENMRFGTTVLPNMRHE